MENTNNQPVASDTNVAPPPVVAENPPINPSTDPAMVKAPPQPTPNGVSKNKLLMILLVVFVIVVGVIVGYYFYQSSKTPTPVAIPTVIPTQEVPTPTIDPNTINNDEKLDEAMMKMDDASTEAELNNELNNLKQDSNF